MLNPVPLERAEVIGIAKLGAQVLKNLPITRLTLNPERLLEVTPQVTLDSIVVEQGVVDIQQEGDVALLAQRPIFLHPGVVPAPYSIPTVCPAVKPVRNRADGSPPMG